VRNAISRHDADAGPLDSSSFFCFFLSSSLRGARDALSSARRGTCCSEVMARRVDINRSTGQRDEVSKGKEKKNGKKLNF
jgi:hypothetical protein